MNPTTTTEPGTRVPFSQAIRESTASDHSDAEHSPFMSALFDGGASLDDYIDLVAQQYLVYEVLERAGAAMADDIVAGRFVFPELHRVPSLEADLRVLVGEDWRERVRPTQATVEYTSRLEEVCFEWPGGFVAHHYTRYMGDLSGGIFIGRAVTEQFDLAGGGASFYTFDEVESPKAFKEAYRARLDEVPWDDAERSEVIDEVHRAYTHNSALLSSIG